MSKARSPTDSTPPTRRSRLSSFAWTLTWALVSGGLVWACFWASAWLAWSGRGEGVAAKSMPWIAVLGPIALAITLAVRSPMTRVSSWIAPTFVALLACVIWLPLSFGGRWAEQFGSRPFDAREWKAQAGSDYRDNSRWHMVESARGHVPPSTSRSDVESILGTPDHRDRAGEDEWLYVLGMWSGFRMDYDFLHVRFDGAGRVLDTRVVQH